jgi:hypothetical protein
MAEQHPKILNLTGKLCRMGKVSNNTEYHGAEEWESAFTIPITGVMLTREELNDFMRDKHCHASWYNTGGKGGLVEPMPWWHGEEFSVSAKYESDDLMLTMSGDRELTFEPVEPDPDDEDDVGRPACVLSSIVLRPQPGGLTELRFSLTLRPGLGKTNLQLQEHQHREIKITLTDAAPIEKASRQPQLPLGDAGGGAEPAATH